METLGIILIIYGILCLFIGILKPPIIWNMAKFKVMEKVKVQATLVSVANNAL